MPAKKKDMEWLLVDDSNREYILDLFDKSLDDDGFIIDKKTNKRIVCPYSMEEIRANSFSILPGSATFVNNKTYCFAEHIAYHGR